MSQTKYIEAHYTQVLQFDIEDLDIDWKDVKDYWVKWAKLHIELKNGEVVETEMYHECDMDWKHPDKTEAFDENFYEVKL